MWQNIENHKYWGEGKSAVLFSAICIFLLVGNISESNRGLGREKEEMPCRGRNGSKRWLQAKEAGAGQMALGHRVGEGCLRAGNADCGSVADPNDGG